MLELWCLLEAFGYGLSYTTFRYSRLAAGTWNRRNATGPTVALTLRDTGRRSGTEVVQVYVGRLPGGQTTPPKQLAGWARVTVTPDPFTLVPFDAAVIARGGDLFVNTPFSNPPENPDFVVPLRVPGEDPEAYAARINAAAERLEIVDL